MMKKASVQLVHAHYSCVQTSGKFLVDCDSQAQNVLLMQWFHVCSSLLPRTSAGCSDCRIHQILTLYHKMTQFYAVR